MTSSYIAKLSSLLTVEQIKLTKGDYIGYSANSFIKGIAGSNLNFTDNRLKPFQSPDDYDKALRLGNRKGGVHAILEELPYLKIFIAKFPSDYAIIESSLITSGFGFVSVLFMKNFTFKSEPPIYENPNIDLVLVTGFSERLPTGP